MKVVILNTPQELQAYLTANAILHSKVVAIYFDGASGKHILVHEV